jgi:GNAT superfamily N-acetyltransferase
MIIREASIADAEVIARVHVDSWRSTYKGIMPDATLDGLSYEQRQQDWERRLNHESRNAVIYVAEDPVSHEVIGFACGGPAVEEQDAPYQGVLYTLYILDAYHRQGIGRQLFLRVVERLIQRNIISLLLWVVAENPARKFYEAMGGQYIKTGTFETNGVQVEEVAYGWEDIRTLII